MTVEDMARRAGLRSKGRGAGRRWACPWKVGADAGRTRPGEPAGCDAQRSPATSVDGDRWYCHRCEAGGGAKTLARLLADDTLPEDYTPPEPERPVDLPGDVDIGEAWAALHSVPELWAEGVARALAARGWPAEMVARVEGHPDIAGVPAVWRGVPAAAQRLLGAIERGRGLLFALRDADGRVRDVTARWTADRPPPDGKKGKRLWGPIRGSIAGPVVFGSLPDAVAHAKSRPVVVVEGEADYLAVCAVAGDRATVIGVPGEGAIGKVIGLLRSQLAPLRYVSTKDPDRVTRPDAEVWIVPDVGDFADEPHRREYLIGERAMLAAVTDTSGPAPNRSLLDVARVRWCPPVLCRSTARRIHPDAADPWAPKGHQAEVPRGLRPKVDAEDMIRQAGADTAWMVLSAGLMLIHDGDSVWRRCSDGELRAAAYRLSLRTTLDAVNWQVVDDNPPEWRPANYRRLDDLAMHWFAVHGARWLKNNLGRPLAFWRGALYDVEADEWLGVLDRLGNVNPKGVGKHLIPKMVARCNGERRGAQVVSPFWSTAGELRIHLQHDDADTCLRVRPGAVELIDNGTRTATGRRVIQEADLDGIDALVYRPEVTAAEGARLLYDHCGRWWTCSPVERVLIAAHMLTSLVRHTLRDRPILWLGGGSSSGKTATVETLTAALYGSRGEPCADFTTVSIQVMGRTQPLIVIDNNENSGGGSNRRQRLERLLLNAATGNQSRTKGTRDGGVTRQPMRAFMAVTAIEPPTLYELANRCLMIHHGPEWWDMAYRPGIIADVATHRSAILSGIARLWSMLLGRMDEVGPLAAMVPVDHPIARLRETLALMAIVGSALGAMDPRWTLLSPADLLHQWLAMQGERTATLQSMGDPLTHAIGALLRRYARVEARPSGQMWQPAVEADEMATRPIFRLCAASVASEVAQSEGAAEQGIDRPIARLTMTARYAETVERYGYAAAEVVGVVGTAAELYDDLVSTMARLGQRQEFVDAVPSVAVLTARWSHMKAWGRVKLSDHSPRRYRWVPVEWADAHVDETRK